MRRALAAQLLAALTACGANAPGDVVLRVRDAAGFSAWPHTMFLPKLARYRVVARPMLPNERGCKAA